VGKFPVRFPCARTPDNVRLMVHATLDTDNQNRLLGGIWIWFSITKLQNTQLQNSYASLNFFCCTAWSITTARLRGTAWMAVARRWAGALIRNSSFESSSSLDGRVASDSISLIETTRPSTTPTLKVNSGASFASFVSTLAIATGSPVV